MSKAKEEKSVVAPLPCPFCMRLGQVIERPCDGKFAVQCRGCKAVGPPSLTREGCIGLWNQRLYQP